MNTELSKKNTIQINTRQTIAMAIIVTILIYIILSFSNTMSTSLYGFWEADEQYRQRAKIDLFYMNINPPKNNCNNTIGLVGTKLSFYILLKSNGNTLVNRALTASVSRRSFNPTSSLKFNVEFDKDVEPIPQTLTLLLDPITSMIVLKKDGKLYGRLFKRTSASFFYTIPNSDIADDEDPNDDPDSTPNSQPDVDPDTESDSD